MASSEEMSPAERARRARAKKLARGRGSHRPDSGAAQAAVPEVSFVRCTTCNGWVAQGEDCKKCAVKQKDAEVAAQLQAVKDREKYIQNVLAEAKEAPKRDPKDTPEARAHAARLAAAEQNLSVIKADIKQRKEQNARLDALEAQRRREAQQTEVERRLASQAPARNRFDAEADQSNEVQEQEWTS